MLPAGRAFLEIRVGALVSQTVRVCESLSFRVQRHWYSTRWLDARFSRHALTRRGKETLARPTEVIARPNLNVNNPIDADSKYTWA